jgi:hypothetical protein
MVDEALAILALLSGHPEGKAAIGAASEIPVLVGVIRNGSLRSKENAAQVMVHLCNGEGEQQQQHLAEAQEQGIVSLLEELAESGTDRGKRKAVQLLERMNRFLKQQSQAQPKRKGLDDNLEFVKQVKQLVRCKLFSSSMFFSHLFCHFHSSMPPCVHRSKRNRHVGSMSICGLL